MSFFMLNLFFIGLLVFTLSCVIVYQVTHVPGRIKLKSCWCGAHWWVKRWFFWRHLDASPFNDQLQNRWTIWTFELADVLVLSVKEQSQMGYPSGPVWDDGTPMWKKSKWQLSPKPTTYCLRCIKREWNKPE